jgi:hypothetical protein
MPLLATFLKERAEHQVLLFLINTFRDKGITRKVGRFCQQISLSKVFAADKCGGEIRGAHDPQY